MSNSPHPSEPVCWYQRYNGCWFAECGVVELGIDRLNDGATRWYVSDSDCDFAEGTAPSIDQAKREAITAALKLLADSTSLVLKLQRQATAPCANCNAIARRDGKCVGCGMEVSHG